jgi:protein RecA
MQRGKPIKDLSRQVSARLDKPKAKLARGDRDGSDQHIVSTGSTLLDLAISGGRFPRGGIPAGIMVEIFGPSGCGKTVLLCEIAGGVQRQGGQVMFRDPEARLNGQFAKLFGLEIANADYSQPDTVTQLFEPIRKWEPQTTNGAISGIFADSLAALSTDKEMTDGDPYGARRAKEFSEECRKVCRVLTQRNHLMVCSNQVRANFDISPWAEKYTTPGGLAIGFYSSLRLRCHNPRKINRERKVGKGTVKRVVGVETQIEVYKSTVWKPYHSAPVSIIYDYGVDNVRSNLEFVKATLGATTYRLGEQNLGDSLDRAIRKVEEEQLEEELVNETIELWHEIEDKFKVERIGKRRV